MTDERTVRVPSHVMTREVGGETVLLDLESETYYGLDEVGTDLLEELRGGATVGAAIDALLERWDVDRDRLASDVDELLEGLVEHRLIEIV